MIEERFIEDDYQKTQELIELMHDGHFEFCNPFLASVLDPSNVQEINNVRSGHFLWINSGCQRWLILCDVSTETRCWNGQKGFQEWLSLFDPRDCNDWLLVPRLYGQIVSFGEPDWDDIRAKQSDDEKRVLEMSRGILVWEYQYRFLLHLADSRLERSQIDTIIREYRRGKSTANDLLEELKLGERSLRAIFDNHRQYFLGTPDYWSSGMISRVYARDS